MKVGFADEGTQGGQPIGKYFVGDDYVAASWTTMGRNVPSSAGRDLVILLHKLVLNLPLSRGIEGHLTPYNTDFHDYIPAVRLLNSTGCVANTLLKNKRNKKKMIN